MYLAFAQEDMTVCSGFGLRLAGFGEAFLPSHFCLLVVGADSLKPESRSQKPRSRSCRNLPSPLLRLPVETTDFLRIQMQAADDAIHALPLPRLLRQHQLIHGPQHT